MQSESQRHRLYCLLRDCEQQLQTTALEAPVDKPSISIGLKAVGSSSSVSTMAPEDDDICEEFGVAVQPQTLQLDSLLTEQVASCFVQAMHGKERGRRQCNHHNEAQQGSHHQQQLPISAAFQHSKVPKNHNLAKEFTRAGPEKSPTTMMIRNIPNRYTQLELIHELESLGFMGSFDFFYSPIDTGTMGNVGYAFVNFGSPAWAARCEQALEGYTFKKHQRPSRKKIATVSVAHLQGLQANIRHYEKSVVSSRSGMQQCGPMVKPCYAASLA